MASNEDNFLGVTFTYNLIRIQKRPPVIKTRGLLETADNIDMVSFGFT